MSKPKLIIKVGFCVAYDWHLLKNSIPRVYKEADIICLSLDKSRRSWSGTPYEFDDVEFKSWIQSMDLEKKINLYEDDFALPNLSAIENDTRQRNLMAEKMGKGGWHIQVDSDEYFVDFKGFKDFLQSLNPNPTGDEKPFNVQVFTYDLFKKLDHGYLVVDPKNIPFRIPFATTKPEYTSAKQSGHFNRASPIFIIHDTWARGEAELRFKLANWGHSTVELKDPKLRESYINLWKAIDEHNYKFVRNFHFAVPYVWDKLKFIPGNSIDEFMKNFKPDFSFNPILLSIVNNRIYGKLKQLFNF